MGGGAHVNHQEPGGSGLAAGLDPKAPSYPLAWVLGLVEAEMAQATS